MPRNKPTPQGDFGDFRLAVVRLQGLLDVFAGRRWDADDGGSVSFNAATWGGSPAPFS